MTNEASADLPARLRVAADDRSMTDYGASNLMHEAADALARAEEALRAAERDAERWQWWLPHLEVVRDKPGDWTCWIEAHEICYRSQIVSVNELTDELIKRFPRTKDAHE